MGRILKPFQGLRWKLSLNYTLVTATTFVVVTILAATGVWFVLANSHLIQIFFISVVKSFIVPPVASYLDNPEPDIQGLDRWMKTAATAEGVSFQSPIYSNIRVTIGPAGQNMTLLVLDENLDYLAGIPEPDEGVLKGLSDLSGGVLAAQAGEQNPERISQISANKILTIALPVNGETGNPLGVVVLMIANPMRALLMQIFSLFGGSIVIFTFAAGIIAAIFGYFSARGMIRRLYHITQTANSWSQGDFSAFIDDRSDDELGQMSESLNRMAEQLQNMLQTRQELATMAERNRLARDLHDSVKQQVFSTVMQVGAARALLDQDPKIAREHLDGAEQLARQAQTELAVIIRELHPADLQERGLSQTLREYVDGWSRLTSITAAVKIRVDQALPLEIEQMLFRVAQEALSNVARHSGATEVEVQVTVQENLVSLTISDNGKGFDVTAAEGRGVGLSSMRARVETLGGSLSLESASGQGTRLVARCKVNREMLP
jgi:signal transduction histidine kinase